MKNILMAGLVLASAAAYGQADNMLTAAEKKQGYKLLFDGKTTKGWHSYNRGRAEANWKVENGTLAFNPEAKIEGMTSGDLISDGSYKNFELMLDWKISKNGNSGVMYHVVERPDLKTPYLSGPEIQVLDNAGHPDGTLETHRAGSLYDMIAANPQNARPAEEWNKLRFVVNGSKLTIFQNGEKVVDTDTNSETYKAAFEKSKFRNWKDFAKTDSGKLALQDHGNMVWYKNIKIRELK